MVDSVCKTGVNCTFSFINETSSPNLTTISPASMTGSNFMTLTGLKLKSGSVCVVSLYNQITKKITVISTDNTTNCTDTSINVQIPNV